MIKDDYLSLFELILDHYVESCFEVPLYVKINMSDFDVDAFNSAKVYVPNQFFKHIELEAYKDHGGLPFSNDVTIVMREHPILNTCKVLEA